MSNILHQKVQEVLSKGIFHEKKGTTTYYFKPVADLLEKNPELINSIDENGDTLLHVFAKIPVSDTISGMNLEQLFCLRANPFIKNNEGKIPLNYMDERYHRYSLLSAYQEGLFIYFDNLLNDAEKNPKILDEQDDMGNTPLHKVAQFVSTYPMKLLSSVLKSKPNPFIKNNEGKTPLDYIDIKKNPESYGQLAEYQNYYNYLRLYGNQNNNNR